MHHNRIVISSAGPTPLINYLKDSNIERDGHWPASCLVSATDTTFSEDREGSNMRSNISKNN